MSKLIKKKMMALMVVGVLAAPMMSFANESLLPISENEAVVIDEIAEMQNKYINRVGTITEVMENKGNFSILVKSDDKDEYGMVFHISEDVSLWNRETEELIKAKDLTKGMEVKVFFHEMTPTTMSLPPQLTPAVIVVQDAETHQSVFMGEFNKDLVSADHSLKLNIGEDTIILNQKGEKLTEKDIVDQAALVFYGVSTKSIPAQTTPSKVIVFPAKEESAVEEAETVVEAEKVVIADVVVEVEDDKIGIEEVKEMISLRDIATQLGYKVEWDNDNKKVEISKQNQMIVIEVGSIDYTLNRSLGKFFKAPELRSGRLYVSASVLDFME